MYNILEKTHSISNQKNKQTKKYHTGQMCKTAHVNDTTHTHTHTHTYRQKQTPQQKRTQIKTS